MIILQEMKKANKMSQENCAAFLESIIASVRLFGPTTPADKKAAPLLRNGSVF